MAIDLAQQLVRAHARIARRLRRHRTSVASCAGVRGRRRLAPDLAEAHHYLARRPRPDGRRRYELVLRVEALEAARDRVDHDVRHALPHAPLVGLHPPSVVERVTPAVGAGQGRTRREEVRRRVGGAVGVGRANEDGQHRRAVLVLKQRKAPLEEEVVEARGGGEARHAPERVPRDDGHDHA